MHFSFRPKDDYMDKASHKELEELAAVWMSQVSFCQDEIKFFKSLLEQNSGSSKELQREHKIQRLYNLIDKKASEVKTLLGRIEMHTVYIDELAEGTYASDEQAFRAANSELEDKICRFILATDKLKAEIFRVLNSDQSKRA